MHRLISILTQNITFKKLLLIFWISSISVGCSKKNNEEPSGENATGPAIEWQKSFDMDIVGSIQQTTDGGYVFTDGDGISFSIGKVSANGDMQWHKKYGSPTPSVYNPEYAMAVLQTTDGGYILTGYASSNNGDVSGNKGGRDFWVVKLDNNGNLQWQKCLGGSENDSAEDIKQTSDGGYIVVGYTQSKDGDVKNKLSNNSSYWVVKLNTTGDIQWEKSYNRIKETSDWATSVDLTKDGGYIIGGTSYTSGFIDTSKGWVIKLTSNGTLEWQKTLGGVLGSENLETIKQTKDNGYILGMRTNSNDGDVTGNHGSGDLWVVKLENNGNMQWQKSLGGSDLEMGSYVQQTTDGGYVVAGSAASKNGDVSGNHGGSGGDAWIVKLSDSGKIQWEKCYGGTMEDGFRDVKQTSDGGFIAAGYGRSIDGDVKRKVDGDCWIVKMKF